MFKMILLIVILPVIILAQGPDKPCSVPEAHQFDFWVGEWTAEWKDADGNLAHGSNHVIRLFDGCVIEENFDGRPGTELIGKSFSVYDKRQKQWKQTWVDNSGGYLDFTGGFTDGKMILSRKAISRKGIPVAQRMIYYNIEENSFEWNWEISYDNGKTWDLKWKLNYTRK